MRQLGLVLVVVFCLVVLARVVAVGFYRVHGTSMLPTLHPGDYMLADKTAFSNDIFASLLSRTAGPSRGDIAVLTLRRGSAEHIVKRVVALPSDTLAMHNGRLRIDGRPLAEPYLSPGTGTPDSSDRPGSWHFSYLLPEKQTHHYQPTGLDWGPLVVPDSAFFVLGDHRGASGDSRSFGFVRDEELVAHPFVFLR